MAQSSTDSNLRGIPAFWPNHTVEPPTQWINRIDQFHLAIIAKENLDIDNLKEPFELETTMPMLESAQVSEKKTTEESQGGQKQRTNASFRTQRRQTHTRREPKIRGHEEIRGRQKVRSILYLALGAEKKRVFSQKHPRVKVLTISFKEFFDLLDTAFIKPKKHHVRTI